MKDFDRKFENFALNFMVILFIIGSFFLTDSLAWDKYDYITYYGYTGKEITAAWATPVSNCSDNNPCDSEGKCSDGTACIMSTVPDEYEYEFYHIDMKVTLIKGTTSDNQVTVVLPRVGHYIAKVRAKKNNCQHEDPNDINSPMVPCYSDWAVSTDPTYAVVDDVHRAWWIFTWISPPNDVVIGQNKK